MEVSNSHRWSLAALLHWALPFQTIIPNPSQNTSIGVLGRVWNHNSKTRTGDRFITLPRFFSALETPEEAQEAPEIFSKLTNKAK